MCKKILVTGAGGYIGQHVVKALLDKGADVIATDIRLDDVMTGQQKYRRIFLKRMRIFLQRWVRRMSACIWHGGTDLSIIPRNISKIWTAITNSSAT